MIKKIKDLKIGDKVCAGAGVATITKCEPLPIVESAVGLVYQVLYEGDGMVGGQILSAGDKIQMATEKAL